MKSIALLSAGTTLVVGLLAARALIVPTPAFRERQWAASVASLGGERGPLLREEPTRWVRVVRETDATLAQPGDVLVEWRGFVLLETDGLLGVVAESGGPATIEIDGHEIVRVEDGSKPRARGALRVAAGSRELVVRVFVPPRRAFFRAVLRLPDGRTVPLEEMTAYPEAIAAGEARRAALFRAWGDPALAAAGLLAGLGLLGVFRRGDPAGRRGAEIAATALVFAGALLVPHGAGLSFWGTFPWGALPPVPRLAVLLAGLVPWALALAGRRLPAPRVPAAPALAFLVALVTLWVLRERRLWGDAWITLTILEGHADIGPFGPFFWKEPLDRLLAVAAVRLGSLVGAGAAAAVAATSCLAGAAVVAAVAAHRRAGRAEDWTAGAVLTAGAMLVFFGHVENYAWVSAAVVVFLLLAMRATGGGSAAGAGLAAGLSVAFHPLAIFPVAPALAATAFAGRDRARAARLLAPAIAVPVLLVVGCLAAGIAPPALGLNRFADDPSVFLPPGRALSPEHLAVVANRFALLLSPGIALAIVAGLARPRFPSPADRPLAAAALGGIAGLLFLHGKIRPDVQDWDLWAVCAFPIALLAGRALRGPEAATTRAWATGVSAAVLLLGALGNHLS